MRARPQGAPRDAAGCQVSMKAAEVIFLTHRPVQATCKALAISHKVVKLS